MVKKCNKYKIIYKKKLFKHKNKEKKKVKELQKKKHKFGNNIKKKRIIKSIQKEHLVVRDMNNLKEKLNWINKLIY